MRQLALTLFNCFLCYVGWYGAIILASYGHNVSACSILAPIILWQVLTSTEPKKRIIVVFIMVFTGFLAESAFIYANLLFYPSGSPPAWVLGLYALIGATFDDIIQWIEGKSLIYLLLILIGGVGGAFNYFLGSKIGAVSFPNGTWEGLVAVGMLWGILFPLIYKLRKSL